MTGWLLTSIVVKATLTMAAALAATSAARRSRAAVRHVILSAAFAMLLILPLASALAPPVRITVPIAATVWSQSSTPETTAGATEIAESLVADADAARQAPHSLAISVSTLLLALWAIGAACCLLPVIIGIAQTRALRRSSRRWRDGQSILDALANDAGVRRRIPVLMHPSISGPLTCGVVRPVIILPTDSQLWTGDDLRCAIVHELEHVRRGDWIAQTVARVVAAGYWFHPIVWLAWRQYTLEAERACDDAVLRRAEATAYADQLVALAQRIHDGSDHSLVAMARRDDLPARVKALLDSRQRRGPVGAACVASTGVAAAALVMWMSPLRIETVAQTPATGQTFEVASVKPCRQEPNTGNQRRPEYRVVSPGRVSIECVTLERIIFFAYAGIGNMSSPLTNNRQGDSSNVRGGPAWVHTDKFTIEAKSEEAADRTTMMGPMLRGLLEDRFQLKTHREAEEVPMYALTVAKGGLRIKPIEDDGCTASETLNDLSREDRLAVNMGPKPVCGGFTAVGDGVNRTWVLGGETLRAFANNTLSGVLDRYVIDSTGVAGRFNIHLEFGIDESIRTGVFGGAGVAPPPAGIEKGPSIFTALEEQLGLKLERTRGPRDYIVIDRAVKPAAD